MIYRLWPASGRRAAGSRTSIQQVFAEIQVDASFIALLIVPPSLTADNAMADPTIARINAYSAAEAPLVSVMRFLRILLMMLPFLFYSA